MYKIHPLPNAEPVEVYCELDIEGGGFTFLPGSLTRRPGAQQIVNALFKDKKNVLLKLQKKNGSSESYTLIQPHPNYTKFPFGVLVNNYTGYTRPQNQFMKEYIFLRIIPASAAKNPNYQVSDPTDTPSSLKTVTQIPTACLRSCQTMIFKLQAIAIVQIWFMKNMVSQWIGVPRPLRSQTLIALCQSSSSF